MKTNENEMGIFLLTYFCSIQGTGNLLIVKKSRSNVSNTVFGALERREWRFELVLLDLSNILLNTKLIK